MSSLTLTANEEGHLPDDVRAEFRAWLEAEGLTKEFILEGTFGEGCLRATVPTYDTNGEIIVLDEWEIATEERTFNLSTPPPSSLLPYLIAPLGSRGTA